MEEKVKPISYPVSVARLSRDQERESDREQDREQENGRREAGKEGDERESAPESKVRSATFLFFIH